MRTQKVRNHISSGWECATLATNKGKVQLLIRRPDCRLLYQFFICSAMLYWACVTSIFPLGTRVRSETNGFKPRRYHVRGRCPSLDFLENSFSTQERGRWDYGDCRWGPRAGVSATLLVQNQPQKGRHGREEMTRGFHFQQGGRRDVWKAFFYRIKDLK